MLDSLQTNEESSFHFTLPKIGAEKNGTLATSGTARDRSVEINTPAAGPHPSISISRHYEKQHINHSPGTLMSMQHIRFLSARVVPGPTKRPRRQTDETPKAAFLGPLSLDPSHLQTPRRATSPFYCFIVNIYFLPLTSISRPNFSSSMNISMLYICTVLATQFSFLQTTATRTRFLDVV